jgi:cell wall-associated NlpC family hydrolase
MKTALICFLTMMTGCIEGKKSSPVLRPGDTAVNARHINSEENSAATVKTVAITKTTATKDSLPGQLVAYAKTLIGTPYKYASANPKTGLDCSGFITCVFNHFNIAVPRSSVDFTDYGKTIMSAEAKPGDLILFTGTDSAIRIVGHMGIIVSNENGKINFIHSSSGKIYGVTISAMSSYYKGRFVKVIRVL